MISLSFANDLQVTVFWLFHVSIYCFLNVIIFWLFHT